MIVTVLEHLLSVARRFSFRNHNVET